MKQEFADIPITKQNILSIAAAVKARPLHPVVVPISYGQVTVPGTFAECIDGVLQDPGTVYIDAMNVPVGPSYIHTDEAGHVYDAISTGVTPATLMTAITALTSSVWTLQLNLGDPSMPDKLREFHRMTPTIGLVAIVTPQAVHEYLNRLEVFKPVVFYPDKAA